MIRPAILILFALFWFSPNASAACDIPPDGTNGNATCSAEGEAQEWIYANNIAQINYLISIGSTTCRKTGNTTSGVADGINKFLTQTIVYCADNSLTGMSSTAYYPIGATCASLPTIDHGQPLNVDVQSGAIRCLDGCKYTYTYTATDGYSTPSGGRCISAELSSSCPQGYIWSIGAGMCDIAPADTDGDGKHDGIDAFPNDPTEWEDTDGDGKGNVIDKFDNDPNEWQDSDNDGVGNNGDIKPNDATNGKDTAAGNGTEKDNTSTGGGNCATPPNSVGDAITGSIAYQTWNTRCQLEKANEKLDKLTATVTGDVGNCNSGFSCTGNSAECAKVYALRVEICPNQQEIIAKLNEIKNAVGSTSSGGTGNSDNSDQNGNGVPDVLEVGTDDTADGSQLEAAVNTDTSEDFESAWSSIDTSGFLGGGGCPSIPTLQLGAASLDFGPILCPQAEAFAAILRIVGLFAAATIISRRE